MKSVLPILLVFAFVTSAHAALDTGSDLLRACELAMDENIEPNIIQSMEAGYCMGLAAGFKFLDRVGGTDIQWCVPEGVTVGQGIRVLLKYMNDNPQTLHWKSKLIAARAFQSSFPCND